MSYFNATELWIGAASSLLDDGSESAPRGMRTKEMMGAQLCLASPMKRVPVLPVRKFSLAYASAELLWYLRGDDSLDFIKYYAPQYERFSDDGRRLWGAYGTRIFGSDNPDSYYTHLPTALSAWQIIKDTLANDPETRQAIIPIYSGSDPGHKTKDVPCTLTLQFLLREGKLSLIVNMRSNDVWLGLPYDLFCFTALQEIMAVELKAKLGVYVHQAGSLHLYEKDWRGARRTIDDFITNGIKYLEGLDRDLPLIADTHGETLREMVCGWYEDEQRVRHGDACDLADQLSRWIGDFSNSAFTVRNLSVWAWAWKKIQSSPVIKESVRQTLQELLRSRLGVIFDRCFF